MCILWAVQEAHGGERETEEKKDVEEEAKPDPLKQLITALSRGATKELQSSLPEDPLYISYAEIMGLVGAFFFSLAEIKLFFPSS